MVSIFSITAERAIQIDYSIPYAGQSAVVIAPKSTAIKGHADLVGKKVGLTRGTGEDGLLTAAAEANPGIEILRFDDYSSLLQAMVSGQIDAMGGGDYLAPAQLVGDFLRNVPSTALGSVEPSYKPGVRLCNLNELLPPFAAQAIREAIPEFNKQIAGFAMEDAILTGAETRTSSPVSIKRDAHSLQSINTPGLYPAGEGAGYAGGILSAAVDGIKIAEAVAKDLLRA